MEQLTRYGWTGDMDRKWQQIARPDLVPARVVADFGTSLKIASPAVVSAELSGKLAHYTAPELMPKIGDWVGACLSTSGRATVEVVIPRDNEIARKAAGSRVVKQIMAANVDIAFVLVAADGDFSVERLKRFVYQLSVSRIQSVIVLNKIDKVASVDSYVADLRHLNLPVLLCAAAKGDGIDEIASHIKPGRTAILLGSSGVGKSTLTNQLLGRDVQATAAVRASDGTGRHTTVHRELFELSSGGLLIDTPGVRELQLWGTEEALDDNFDDITLLISQCKYTTCQHRDEEGCAVRQALEDGQLVVSHYASYRKMQAELKTLHEKNIIQQRRSNQRSRKSISRQAKDALRDDW